MERRFLPVLFLLLTVTASTVLATSGSGNGGLQDPAEEENSGMRPEPVCRIPPYSDPGRVIRESGAIDKGELLLEGRCYVACASHINRTNPPSTPSDKPKIERMYDISVYWPTVKVRNCKFERMVSQSSTWVVLTDQRCCEHINNLHDAWLMNADPWMCSWLYAATSLCWWQLSSNMCKYLVAIIIHSPQHTEIIV